MNHHKTVYTAGKITGVESFNTPKFYAAEKLLRDMGYGKVVNPHKLCIHLGNDAPWHLYMRRCLKEVAASDIVFLLDDWYKSRGARWEARTARKLAIEVMEIESMLPISDIKYYWLLFKGFFLLKKQIK